VGALRGPLRDLQPVLLEDEFTADPVNLAELAHNVGHKPTATSPRWEDTLPLALRNLAENLLPLCGDDHRVIDSKLTRGEYTVEGLREIKRRHADRIRYRYIFRRDSQHTHAAVASLEPLVLGSPPGPFQVISVETDPGIHTAFTIAPVVYGMALMFAEPMLGISGLQRAADDVFARTSSFRLDGPVGA
jgi:hypothetical protein